MVPEGIGRQNNEAGKSQGHHELIGWPRECGCRGREGSEILEYMVILLRLTLIIRD